jgi:acetate kinase
VLGWLVDEDLLRVHGGPRFAAPVRIDDAVVAEIRRLIPLAPLHQPHHLLAIEALTRLHPALPQVACFDTAFHHGQSVVATTFALPRSITEEGVRRYGFHGLSYEYIASVLPAVVGPEIADGRVVVAHLGSGAGLCALHVRKSIATTMGFTALDGLPMSERCGALDPGAVLYLIEQKSMSAREVTDMLYHASGLPGVSGVSGDMRMLLASQDAHAAEAIELFVYRVSRELGSLAAALGGIEALVFTAGIGEQAAQIRQRVCDAAAWLGVELDVAANGTGGPRLTRVGGKVSAWVIPTDEDLMIARHTWRLLDVGRDPGDGSVQGQR